jgi:hypothetical protein
VKVRPVTEWHRSAKTPRRMSLLTTYAAHMTNLPDLNTSHLTDPTILPAFAYRSLIYYLFLLREINRIFGRSSPHISIPAENFALPNMVVVDIEVISDLVCVVGVRLRSSKPKDSKKRADSGCGFSGAILASEHWKMLYLCTRKPIREERTTSSPSRGDRIISITTHRRTALTSANLWRASSAG